MENNFENNIESEWYDGNDPEIDFNELNKTSNVVKYANTSLNNINDTDFKPAESFQKLKLEYDITNPNRNLLLNETRADSSSGEENPIHKFHKLKSEIDLIEKDLQFYSTNKELFTGKCSLEKSFAELKNLKIVSEYIMSSDNYRIMNEIKQQNVKMDKESYKLLNKRIYEKLNEHLIHKTNIINKLKSEKVKDYDNVQYELYLTPDTTKIKLFSRMIDIKKAIQNMESKIGAWDVKAKKLSVAEVVNNIKNNLRLFDKEYQKEIQVKMEALNTRLKDINEGKEEFYQTIHKNRLDDLYKSFNDFKGVEDLIFKTVAKMESLQNNHEESAYIFLKLKELLQQNEKLGSTMDSNLDILKILKENITSNVQVMKKNVSNIKERLNKVTENK